MHIRLHRQHKAGTDRLTVQENGTGTTHALFATHVSPGQPQFVSQKITQQKACLYLSAMRNAVDSELDRVLTQGSIHLWRAQPLLQSLVGQV